MKIQQIRNACVRINYGGKTFLMDPWLMDKGAMGTFSDLKVPCADPSMENIPMPMCALPMPVEEVLEGVDAYVITHVHPDHIDIEADGTVGKILLKDTAAFVQSSEDAQVLLRSGFTDINVLYENSALGEVELIKTPGRHGTKIPCGPASGVIFRHPKEKTLYVAGDTIWYDGVKETLLRFKPEVVIVNACAAALRYEGRLIMNHTDVALVHEACPHAKIVISHMDTVAHATITRSDMKGFLKKLSLEEFTIMPDDGETLSF
ncbi:MAG: MBL fold metallo-hydrolase [Desulfovibrionaceae bacterium]|nr:MBL fold metallo-hydrolase [Desulfovibrionaceae bacterium]